MQLLSNLLSKVDELVWGPPMIILLVGTGIYLTLRTRFLTWRNLGYAIKLTLGKESRTTNESTGDISPFSALTTGLAATIGTGNIVGVATAMVAGGPGALVWMWLSSLFGLTTKFSECMLAIKYRDKNQNGEMTGGPMVTIKNTFKNKKLGNFLSVMFAFSAFIASFGIGNMTQGNSISSAMNIAFNTPTWLTGIIITLLAFVIIVGGIKTISKVSEFIVPFMGILYLTIGFIVILGNFKNVPGGIYVMIRMAFSMQSVGSGLCGSIVVSIFQAMRFGIARGCFTNEAGMGSAAIAAAAAASDEPVKQGYVNMTSVFWDTIVICSITGLCIASSGMLGQIDPATGELYTGVALTMAAFSTVLGKLGTWGICICIALFAFATILGWEYYGEKAFEYLVGTYRYNTLYRIIFSFIVFIGCTTTLQIAWDFSDIANAFMCIPNLLCLLYLRKEIVKDICDYQVILNKDLERR